MINYEHMVKLVMRWKRICGGRFKIFEIIGCQNEAFENKRPKNFVILMEFVLKS